MWNIVQFAMYAIFKETIIAHGPQSALQKATYILFMDLLH